ncbi:protein of unknown function (plasmid) [Azospirillum lipoferum 4B]|uniref:Uncharacterized protein n=1 Tax=Azospirillum lipoferum (strain 4B) TaxID=862719 RepID=G7ZIN0_AZOL4|nr:protein of unknown function [Azospirillum lipoferum 4B]
MVLTRQACYSVHPLISHPVLQKITDGGGSGAVHRVSLRKSAHVGSHQSSQSPFALSAASGMARVHVQA